MGRRGRNSAASKLREYEFPLLDTEWDRVVKAMKLSPRQADIVSLILRGNCDKQIACTLGLSLPTVRTHLRQIFVSENIESRVQLVLRVFALARKT